ncbi:MBL fold metallo-hydrolase [Streptomyces tateyamensis]|uniref:MBL fold metallo-hydrolase n=1 Tax=Streptomyces tateyamensis TaxID=565073 RepID=UPI0011B3D982|nr:MBL fold metallo-hydrolase [Streptomyces tateyamensis]
MTAVPPPEPPAVPRGAAESGSALPARGGTAAPAGVPNGATAAPLPGPPLEVAVFTGSESARFATSSLILGQHAAVLVDAQPTRSAGRELAEWIAGKGRQLLAVLITHPHPAHYFGAEEVLRLFPQAQVLAAAPVVAAIAATAAEKAARWRLEYGDDVPDHPVLPGVLRPQPLLIDRQLIRVLNLGQADCPDSTVVHVPGSRTVVAGDFAYNGTHVWTAETTPADRQAWLGNLGRIADLGVDRVIAGHRAPDHDDDAARVLTFTGEYLRDFDRLLAEHPHDPDVLITAMGQLYGELTLPTFLTAGAIANTAPGGDA